MSQNMHPITPEKVRVLCEKIKKDVRSRYDPPYKPHSFDPSSVRIVHKRDL
jgi:hypothetical protein